MYFFLYFNVNYWNKMEFYVKFAIFNIFKMEFSKYYHSNYGALLWWPPPPTLALTYCALSSSLSTIDFAKTITPLSARYWSRPKL